METHLTVEPVYGACHGLTGFRVAGSDNDVFNGNYHQEPDDSDGVPCYRKYFRGCARPQVIRRRNGYWFIDSGGGGGGFSNEGCGPVTPFYKPPKTGWFPIIEYYSDGSLELTDDEGEYEVEYENGELPEDNSEKAIEIKDAVKVLGEKVFDIQGQLKEGDYLELMNLLQRVTNKVNS